MPIRQSVCYPLFKPPEMSLDELFAAAAAIGYAAVELWHPGDDFDQVAETAHKHKLVVASMIGHHSLSDGLNRAENHDRIEEELSESIDLAVRCGVPGLICFSGNRRPGINDVEAIEITAAGLRRVAPYAEKHGVNLNLELLNSKRDHPGYQCDHAAWGLAVCQRVDSPRVRLLYDIYHMQIMEGDLIRTITDHIRWIAHFHTAGVPGRKDPDETQEINYAAVARAIAATGYSLYIGHEFKPAGDPLAALRKTFDTFNH